MAAPEMSTIERMIEEAKQNVTSAPTTTTAAAAGSTGLGEESGGIQIERQSSAHIPGQAKSGDLQGKKVNINGVQYVVSMQSQDDYTETVVLTRELDDDTDTEDECEDLVSHISGMGYESIDDIKFSKEELEFGKIQIGEKMGETIDILMVNNDGDLCPIEIELEGINWEDNDYIDILCDDMEDERMHISVLITSYLLFHEWIGSFVPSSSEDEEEVQITKLSNNQDIDELPSDVPDSIKRILKSLMDQKKSDAPDRMPGMPDGIRDLLDTLDNSMKGRADLPDDLKRVVTLMKKHGGMPEMPEELKDLMSGIQKRHNKRKGKGKRSKKSNAPDTSSFKDLFRDRK